MNQTTETKEILLSNAIRSSQMFTFQNCVLFCFIASDAVVLNIASVAVTSSKEKQSILLDRYRFFASWKHRKTN